jgi:sterol desaturase/sphingolipid hydroxylase (fatty acid hydroxylase superfamily)
MVLRVVHQVLLFLGLGTPFFLLEQRFAAHRVRYERVVAGDVVAYVIVVLLGIPTSTVMNAFFEHVPLLAFIPHAPPLPVWASVPLAVVCSDLAMYWTHRLIHTAPFWPAHRWHHSPRHMYWMAGGRASFTQGLIYAFPFLAFVVFRVPPPAIGGYALFGILLNHWMHTNIGLKCRWLEAIFITPRIHHIHHSRDPRHFGRNLGSLFSIWDRLFGTFYSPDKVEAPLEFGIPEPVSPPRLIAGV